MDVQQMQVGTTLLLPCFIDGCGLFVGDVHYAQGDGEVSGTAIEMGAVVTVRTEVLEGGGSDDHGTALRGRRPAEGDRAREVLRHGRLSAQSLRRGAALPRPTSTARGSARLENLSEDLTLAARSALIDMIDYIEREHGLTREQAYVLSSVAVDLVIGQVVDVPNYTVSAILDLEVFE